MSNPTCTVASLITTNPCFNSGCVLNDKQRRALQIWFMAKELARIGGTDYTTNLVGTSAGGLLFDSTAIFKSMHPEQRKTAELAIYYNNAVNSGATISTDMDTLMGSVVALVQSATDFQLQEMYLKLLCELGFSKTRPQ